MSIVNRNRIMIAGTNSGCGKTTVTCALLKAFVNQGIRTASFKCGPDYIDPMFHSEVLGIQSRNIDFFLCGEKTAGYLFEKNSRNYDLSVIEGVMGFYDGMGGSSYKNSSYDISQRLKIPVVLVVNCKGASLSVAAMIKGYLELYPNLIQGVILNQVSSAMYPVYKESIEQHLKIRVYGFMPLEAQAVLESRHLGLVTAGELTGLKDKLDLLAACAGKYIDLTGLYELAKSAQPFEYDEIEVKPISQVRLAVAKDKAFCFYYEDSLSLLKELGATLQYVSPLEDPGLPEGIHGLILGGGYPELYLEKLSSNRSMRNSIQRAYRNGLPIYGECGGYMYLGETIGTYPMAGILPMHSEMTDRLQNFGYASLTTKKDNFLLSTQETIPAHEFHYSVTDQRDLAFDIRKASGKCWQGGYADRNLFALYPHLHFWGNKNLAIRLIRKCEEFRDGYQNRSVK